MKLENQDSAIDGHLQISKRAAGMSRANCGGTPDNNHLQFHGQLMLSIFIRPVDLLESQLRVEVIW